MEKDNFVAPVCHEDIEILFKDEHILLINKPSGLLSLSGKNPLNLDSVHYRLVNKFPSATMVHRLDLGTSGLMLIALTKAANSHLTKQFQMRTVAKQYEAILSGLVYVDCEVRMNAGKKTVEREINFPIAKDKENFPRLKICEETGKQAVSHLCVLKKDVKRKTTRVKFTPITGRTHQLRIHSQAIGHPILGCDLYGTEESLKASSRLLLHATRLKFVHPFSGRHVSFHSPCPF